MSTESSPPLVSEVRRACLGCGYDLREQDPEGVCPECGMPVKTAIEQGVLDFQSPRAARALKRGLWVLSACLVVYLPMQWGLLFDALWAVVSVAEVAMLLSNLSYVLVLVAWCGGWWLILAAFNPAWSHRAARVVRRVRILLLCEWVLTMFWLALIQAGVMGWTGHVPEVIQPVIGGVMWASILAAKVASVIGLFGLLWLARELYLQQGWRRQTWRSWCLVLLLLLVVECGWALNELMYFLRWVFGVTEGATARFLNELLPIAAGFNTALQWFTRIIGLWLLALTAGSLYRLRSISRIRKAA